MAGGLPLHAGQATQDAASNHQYLKLLTKLQGPDLDVHILDVSDVQCFLSSPRM